MVTEELMRSISAAAFNSRDVERIVACFAEDGVFCLARGPESVGRILKGKAAIRKALTDRIKQIPDLRWDNEDYILASDHAVSVWTVRGKAMTVRN
jgi:ketosteroid isomerase-like protein